MGGTTATIERGKKEVDEEDDEKEEGGGGGKERRGADGWLKSENHSQRFGNKFNQHATVSCTLDGI